MTEPSYHGHVEKQRLKSYAADQVPGLNAPIPPGTQFGYQAGGWGKPPVNEEGEPLYGDVFGQFADEEDDEQVQYLPFALLQQQTAA